MIKYVNQNIFGKVKMETTAHNLKKIKKLEGLYIKE
jgi:hypothetical protein